MTDTTYLKWFTCSTFCSSVRKDLNLPTSLSWNAHHFQFLHIDLHSIFLSHSANIIHQLLWSFSLLATTVINKPHCFDHVSKTKDFTYEGQWQGHTNKIGVCIKDYPFNDSCFKIVHKIMNTFINVHLQSINYQSIPNICQCTINEFVYCISVTLKFAIKYMWCVLDVDAWWVHCERKHVRQVQTWSRGHVAGVHNTRFRQKTVNFCSGTEDVGLYSGRLKKYNL